MARVMIWLSCVLLLAATCQGLENRYYRRSCPQVEFIVRGVVDSSLRQDPGLGAGLIRMAFHDCFVQGCDGSILLDPTPANPRPEKRGPPNDRTQHGFEVIDAAKAAVENACPGVVSCADIVQYAARDASSILSNGRINYRLPGGRFDGRISLDSETGFLPAPFFNLSELTDRFRQKGLSVDDLVVLSGAHSAGHVHCSSFTGRIGTLPADSFPPFATATLSQCPRNPTFDNDPTVDMDVTPNLLDNNYYNNLLRHQVFFKSDAELMRSPETARMVRSNARSGSSWERKFGRAMVKMAAIEVKTAANGEIRSNCRVVN